MYHLNCWEVLKLPKLQRGDETNPGVNVAKAEKIREMAYG